MPLPKGYTLDQSQPSLPAGYVLDNASSAPRPYVDTSNVAGAPASGVPGLAPHPAVRMNMPAEGTAYSSTPANVVKGIVKSVPGTFSSIDNQVAKVPGIGDWLTTPLVGGQTSEQQRKSLYDVSQTHGTAQAIGKGIGDAAQFLIPGPQEERLSLYGASKLPMLGKYAAPIARLGAQALGSGAVNAAQGGGFGTGAAAGTVGGLFGEGIRAAAPLIAEGAMGIRAVDRAYGRTPGKAILSETSGFSPGKIAEQARNKVSLYSTQLDSAADNSNVPVDLLPARDKADSWLQTAYERNNDATTKQVAKIGAQLDSRGQNMIPQSVSAREGLSLKRGLDDLKTSWNPAVATDFGNRAVDSTVHALHPELEAAIPEYRNLNSKISSLFPVAQRASAKDLNAGFIQRSVGRFGAHTGALVGAGAGGAFGYKEGGLPGAVFGATAGIAGPEIIASPEFQMLGARAFASPVAQKGVVPLLSGGTLAASRKRPSLYEPQ